MRRYILALLVMGSNPLVPAQNIEYPDWDRSVQFLFVASQKPVRPGDDLEFAVLADIAPGYHLYGPEEKRPSRTEIDVLEARGLQWGITAFPPVIKRDLAGLGEYDLYEGEIAIRLPAKVNDSVGQDSEVYARIEVKYQVCTESACSPPTSTVMEIRIPIAGQGEAVRKLHPDVFDDN
jgi:hypothetical protein